KYKMRVEELEVELSKKKKMPKGGNVHAVPGTITKVRGKKIETIPGILFMHKLRVSLKEFMSKVEPRVDRNGRKYNDWRKAMEFAKSDENIKLYASAMDVQITHRNLERWYKYHVTREITLNTTKHSARKTWVVTE
uniref:hypothetical protein n=1 Tax=Clostridioides difficile TaxID=1496 RepID=UPI00319E2AC2